MKNSAKIALRLAMKTAIQRDHCPPVQMLNAHPPNSSITPMIRTIHPQECRLSITYFWSPIQNFESEIAAIPRITLKTARTMIITPANVTQPDPCSLTSVPLLIAVNLLDRNCGSLTRH